MKIKDSFFLIVLIPTITALIVSVLILCSGEFDRRGDDSRICDNEYIQGTWMMIESPYSVLDITEDSLLVRNDSLNNGYRYTIKDDNINVFVDSVKCCGEFFTRNGLVIPGGVINVLLIKNIDNIDGTYIRKK